MLFSSMFSIVDFMVFLRVSWGFMKIKLEMVTAIKGIELHFMVNEFL